jgi:purine catabolism regulator
MAVTISELLGVGGLSLRLLAGGGAAERPLRWVHTSELEDPTPWLRGGELLLTTGMGVGDTAARQRAYIKRLAEAGVAGLGFGLGFSHDRVPRPLVSAADAADLPLVEIPYPVPFIALTEAVFSRLAAEQYDELQQAFDAEHTLTRAVLEGGGVEGISRSLAAVVGGWALLLDLHGMALAATSRTAASRRARVWDEIRDSRPEAGGFSLTVVDGGDHVWVQPVGPQGRVEAFLAVGKPEAPSHTDRIVAGHALSLIAIELAKSRAVAEAERRLQGDFFDQLASGTLPEPELHRGLTRFGFARDARLRVASVEDADAGSSHDDLGHAAGDVLSRRAGAFLVSPHGDGINVLLSSDTDLGPKELAGALEERVGAVLRVGEGSVVGPAEVGRSLREAGYALRVCRLEGWGAAGFEDLGTYRLLLSMTEPDALRAFADSMLAAIDAYDASNGGELARSLEAFLRHNARWEAAAGELFVHRHTLRYRMRKVEDLTGRDLSSSFDRMEFWLALRARQLLSAPDG